MRHRNIRRRKGFTLIELIVVIVILGILAGIGITRFTSIIRRSSVTVVEKSATDFNRAVLTLTAQKATTASVYSSRDASTLVEMFEAGDGPNGVTVSTLNAAKTSSIVIWDGAAIQNKADLEALTSGFPIYLQFVKNGASACLRLSSDGSATPDASGTATGSAVPVATGGASGNGWIVLARVAKDSATTPASANACNLVAAAGYTDAGTSSIW